MSTRNFFLIVVTVLGLLSALAYVWRPNRELRGRTQLVWVSDNNPVRTEQINAFNEANPNLHLTLDYNNSGAQKVILQCSSGVGPDLFDLGEQDLQTYVDAGILYDVTEISEKMNFSVQKQAWPQSKEAALCFGRQYTYYCNTGVNILMYNKNVFDYFGVPYPKEDLTWEEFVELSRNVNHATSEPKKEFKISEQIYAVTGASWQTYFESQRGEYFTQDGLLNLDSPEMRAALQFHKDMLFKYKLMPTTVEMRSMSGQGGWGSGNNNHFAAGRYAMMINGDWAMISFIKAYMNQLKTAKDQPSDPAKGPYNMPLRLGAVRIPHMTGSQPCYKVGARMAGINARSPHRDEALRVLQYFAGPTYSRILNEGNDWLPGNPTYADVGVKDVYPELARGEMHEITKASMAYGYLPRRSPFLLTSDITRVLGAQVARLESDSRLEVPDLISAATAELMTLLRRNIDRDPELKKKYEAFSAAASPTPSPANQP